MAIVKSGTTGIKRAKVVLLGAPGVGKTSLVRRYVHSVFSDQHKSTLGVKVDRKSISLGDLTVAMLIWDMHGETDGLDVPPNYLSGAAAGLVVFDATRPETVPVALDLGARLTEGSPDAKILYVANKADLDFDLRELTEKLDGQPLQQTSAKTGDGVEELFIEAATSIS